jgi:hypothetical protein
LNGVLYFKQTTFPGPAAAGLLCSKADSICDFIRPSADGRCFAALGGSGRRPQKTPVLAMLAEGRFFAAATVPDA